MGNAEPHRGLSPTCSRMAPSAPLTGRATPSPASTLSSLMLLKTWSAGEEDVQCQKRPDVKLRDKLEQGAVVFWPHLVKIRHKVGVRCKGRWPRRPLRVLRNSSRLRRRLCFDGACCRLCRWSGIKGGRQVRQ